MSNEVSKADIRFIYSSLNEKQLNALIRIDNTFKWDDTFGRPKSVGSFLSLAKEMLGNKLTFSSEEEALEAFRYFLLNAPSKYDNDETVSRKANYGDK